MDLSATACRASDSALERREPLAGSVEPRASGEAQLDAWCYGKVRLMHILLARER